MNPQKETAQLILNLKNFSTCELCDGTQTPNTMDYTIKPVVNGKKIAGTAFTVDLPMGDGQLVTEAILKAKPGDVIVISGKSNTKSSLWGDHRSLCAKIRGLEGVVIDGMCRDIEGLREIDFPVYAKGVVCQTALKTGLGSLNVPIECGGAVVRPGDFIIGDENGVCIIAPEDAEKIMEKSRKKISAQNKVQKEMTETGKIW